MNHHLQNHKIVKIGKDFQDYQVKPVKSSCIGQEFITACSIFVLFFLCYVTVIADILRDLYFKVLSIFQTKTRTSQFPSQQITSFQQQN